MLINLFLCFILISNFFLDAASQSEKNLPQIIALARIYRLHPEMDALQEEARKKDIVLQAENLLPSYQKEQDLAYSVKLFVHDSIAEQRNFTIERETDGTTEDVVFLIFEESQLVYAVKAFKNVKSRRGKFLTELSALDFIAQSQFEQSSPVTPLAVASCVYQGEQYVLLLETAAGGKRLDQFVLEAGKAKGDIRDCALQLAAEAYAQAGRALAELHSRKSLKTFSIPQINREKFKKHENAIFSNPGIVKAIEKEIPIRFLKEYLAISYQEALKLLFPYTYWHGDAHSENLFYDLEIKRIYFIDVVRLHASIDIFGDPILDGAADLLHLEENLRKLSLFHLSEGETERLLQSFYQAYIDVAGTLPDARHLNFYRNYFKLARLIECYDAKDEKKKAIFNQALGYFVNEIRLARRQA